MIGNKPLAIDLFAGAGGMSEGIIQAGFHIVYSNEINPDAALTYEKRHNQLGLFSNINTVLEIDDIRKISGESILNKISKLPTFIDKKVVIDAIFGGPPCQGFSRAGKQNVNDTRNQLFKEYLRIIYEIKPKYIVFENVEGITDIKFSDFQSVFDEENYKSTHALDIIVNELDKIGYESLDYKILNAVHYGVPQNRKRIILIAFLKGLTKPSYPSPIYNSGGITVEEALQDLYTFEVKTQYQKDSIFGRTPHTETLEPIKRSELNNNELTIHRPYIAERFSLLYEGENLLALRKRIKTDGIDLKSYPKLTEHFSSRTGYSVEETIELFKSKKFRKEDLDILLTKKNSRTKLSSDKPSNTILTLPDDIISPFNNRIFSVRELARLQSFDDSFIFYGKRTTGSLLRKKEIPQYTQVGNAVPPLLAKAIAKEIFKVL